MSLFARLLILLFASQSGFAQDGAGIHIEEVLRGEIFSKITVVNPTGKDVSYRLEYSADLSGGSWVEQEGVVQSVPGLGRAVFIWTPDGEVDGFVRVVATFAEEPSVLINEVMSNNGSTVTDGDGNSPDWIELYNPSGSAADVSGFYLSDNDGDLRKWVFPAGSVIEAGGYLLVFASGKEGAEIPAGELHAGFKLSNGSEPVIFSDRAATIVDRLDPGPLGADHSVGRGLDKLETLYVFDGSEPSPGEPNHDFGNNPPMAYVQAPIFSVRGGTSVGPVVLELGAPKDGDVIRYTTDGSEPTSGSPLYGRPIELTETTVIRAIVSGAPSSRAVTHTYLVGVEHDLPVMAMATEPSHFDFTDGYLYGFGAHMFTRRGDIIGTFPYSSSNAWKRDREVEASVEFYEPGDGETMRMNVGVKIFGGWGSRGYAQKSMALFARAKYGYGKIRHRFFPDKPVETFESIVLRNSGNDNQSTWLTYPRPPIDEFSDPASHGSYFVNCNFTMFRDAMMQSLMDETSLDTQGYRPTVLYVNGDYWGIYNIREKFTEHYVESTHGVATDNVDLIEGYGSANSGSSTIYNRMRDFINRRSMNDAANYQTVAEEYLEIDNFIDYHLAVIYGQNFDIGNIKCWRRRSGGDGRFRWMLYDQDYSFNLWKPEVYLPAMARDYSDYDNMFEFCTNPRGSGTGWPNSGGRTLLLREMLESDGFRERFAQRCADLLNTLLRSDRVVARIDEMADVIRPEMAKHLTRWSWAGIQARGFGIPHKEEDEPLSLEHWERNVEVMREFARSRPGKLRRDLIDHFGLAGGTSTVTVSSSDPAKGTVKVNSVDANAGPWSGTYFRAYPPTLTAVPRGGARFVGWSGAVEGSEASIQLPLAGDAVSVTAVFE